MSNEEDVPRAKDLREWGIRIARGVGPKALGDMLSDDEWWEQIVDACGFPPEGTEWHTRVVEALLALGVRGPDRVIRDGDGGVSIYLFSAEKTTGGGSVRRASIVVGADGACLSLWQINGDGEIAHEVAHIGNTPRADAVPVDMADAAKRAIAFVGVK